MKYVILSDSDNVEPFIEPRQLAKINGEPLVKRTIRLLKENGIKDILITSHDPRFDNLGAIRYEPKYNSYKGKSQTGYWLDAFPQELMVEPITYLLGDVYFSEDAIKTIVNSKTNSILFFCTDRKLGYSDKYIKHHDEPFGFKVMDHDLFKKHIELLKKMYDEGKTGRHPIAWELYRSINGLDVNKHELTVNYIAINDETCDIDRVEDIYELKIRLGGVKMIKVQALREFTYGKFNEIKNLVRHDETKKLDGRLYEKDTFECTKDACDYLTGGCGYVLVKILEVIPEETPTELPTEHTGEETTQVEEEPVVEATVEYTEEEQPKIKFKKSKKRR